jgi:hypothetical protein
MWCKYLLVWMLVLAGCSSAGGLEPTEDVNKQVLTVNPSTQENLAQTTPQQATPESQEALSLNSSGLAPELTNEVWINSVEPLRLADLRGKVILLEMWTFG